MRTEEQAPPEAEPKVRTLLRNLTMMTLAVLLIIIVAFSLMAPGLFTQSSNFVQLAQNVAILTVVSVGTTFVIITAGVDLSIPSGIVLGEVFAVHAMQLIHTGGGNTAADVDADKTKAGYLLAALAGALLAGLIIGAINGVVVAYLKVPPLLATLGTLGAGLGAALILQHGVNTSTYALDPVGHGSLIGDVPNLVVIALLVVIAGFVLLHMAVFGRHTYAIGSNPEAARRAGINVERHLVKVYLIGASRRASPASCPSPTSAPPASAATPPTTCRRSPPSHWAAPACSAASAPSSARSSASGSRPYSRTASSSPGSSRTGRTSRWASCSSWRSGSTSSAAAPATAVSLSSRRNPQCGPAPPPQPWRPLSPACSSPPPAAAPPTRRPARATRTACPASGSRSWSASRAMRSTYPCSAAPRRRPRSSASS
jgi:ribose/xylose/arabinose/galactoside ABC-type transport system permease subunit